jgi:protease stability complex PrcB-like protein
MAIWSLVIAAALQAGGPPSAPMTTIEKGTDSAVESARQAVARTDAEWATLWQSHAWDRDRPKVDFTRDMVIGVFMGTRPTAGFSVEIVGAHPDNGVLVVRYRETTPGRNTMTAQILTAPYHLVSIARFDGEVKFEKVAAR